MHIIYTVFIYMYVCIYMYVFNAIYIDIYTYQGLLYHRTCKRDFLCSWPALNSYLK